MNFYKHHIGDYAEATAHLSFVEDAAYSRLIRKYYATEKPIPGDFKAAQRLVGARSRDEKDAVQSVLEEFFILQPDGWHNRRCDAELAKANAQADTNRRIAEEREARRRERTQHGSLHEPLHESFNEHDPTREPSQTPDAKTPDTTSQTPDLETGEINGSDQHDGPSPRPSIATAVCLALKAEGIGIVSPGHPRLAELIAAGAEVQNFVDAARTVNGKAKGFAYILGIVDGQLSDARQLASASRSRPKTANGHSGSTARAARMAEAVPGLSANGKHRPPRGGETIEAEVSDVTPRIVG